MTLNVGTIIAGKRVRLIKPTIDFADEFVHKANQSKPIHHPWTTPPLSHDNYRDYLAKISLDNQEGMLITPVDDLQTIGVININEIVRGAFQSGYLGYYIFSGYQQQGYMAEGLQLAISYAFTALNLHRLEANIQPKNTASIALIKKLGFIEEGYSKKYLNINGVWQDHVRFAILNDD